MKSKNLKGRIGVDDQGILAKGEIQTKFNHGADNKVVMKNDFLNHKANVILRSDLKDLYKGLWFISNTTLAFASRSVY
jgi:hypothetical protein